MGRGRPGLDRSARSAAARENARRSREVISTELWESINITWHDAGRAEPPGSARTRSSPGCASGPPRSTAPPMRRSVRDEAWLLPRPRPQPRAGRHDRAAGGDPGAGRRRRAVLGHAAVRVAAPTRRSCAAPRGAVDDRRAAEFLLLDPLFPRSMMRALVTAEGCLAKLGAQGDPLSRRIGARRNGFSA